MTGLPAASTAATVTLKGVPAVSPPPFCVVTAKALWAPAWTVTPGEVPLTPPSPAVIVGVWPALVRVKPMTVTAPAAKVWLPSAGLAGATPPGELVAVQVQVTLWLPV